MKVTSEPTVSVPPEVGDVHAVDRARDRVELEDLLESLETLARVDVEDLGLGVLGQVAPKVEGLEGLDLVAEPGGLLELELLARRTHLLFHLLEQDILLAVEEESASGGCRRDRTRDRSAGCRAPCTG